MKIAVIGTGYVGLVTGTCFAETGNIVTCVDIDQNKIDKLNGGIVPIYEPHLETLFKRNTKEGRLKFTTSIEDGIKNAAVIFLALPTPPGEDGSADLKYILGVAEKLGTIIKDYKVIVDKSTVPVGTSELVYKAILRGKPDTEFDVVSNPEFLREGFAVDDFMKPDRVVIGTSSDYARKTMEELYKPFVRQGNPIIFMDEKSAEMTKYAANSFLAMKISYMNEIANICEKVGADVDMVRSGIGSDNRIGKRFLFPGIGYGGSCFPKDVLAMHKTSKDVGYDFSILESVMKVNETQKERFMNKVFSKFGNDVSGKRFGIWGLAFKPDTDDIREAPALYIINELLKAGATVSVFDPEAMENVKAQIWNENLIYSSNHYDALNNADALIVATEWSVFRTPDFDQMSARMKSKIIFDGRNLYDVNQMEKLGFSYHSVGRRSTQVNVSAVLKS